MDTSRLIAVTNDLLKPVPDLLPEGETVEVASRYDCGSCPFCEDGRGAIREPRDKWRVECLNCGAMGPIAEAREEAVAKWRAIGIRLPRLGECASCIRELQAMDVDWARQLARALAVLAEAVQAFEKTMDYAINKSHQDAADEKERIKRIIEASNSRIREIARRPA